MKKNGFLAIIAMAALSFAACNKEGLPQNDATDLPSDEPVVETPVVLEPGVYPATIVAEPIMPDIAGTKAVFDNGAFAWEAGDAIACFQHFDVHAETNVITTMTTAAGDGNFAGSLPYTESETYTMNFIHPASVAIGLVGVGTNQNEQLEINLPSEQDGRLGNLGNYFIAGKAKVSCVVSKDDPISITTENVILNKYPVFAVKVDVPEAYNAQSIKIEALRDGGVLGLAGKSYLNVNNCQHKGPNTYPSAKYLTISHNDDSQISGDTYGVMMPYGKDKADPCTVNKIKFTVTTSSSQTYTFAKSVSELERGHIYDLGTFPTSCVTPKFSFDENGAVVMTSSPAEAMIYYTTDGSDPSDPSAEATLYQGPVEITADTQFKAVAICEGLGNSAVAEELMYGSVVAPVVKIDASGRLTIESIGGHTYKYSISSDENIPSDPEEDFPTDGLEIATGSHMIKVMATHAAGEVAVTNVYYRVVAAVGEQFDLAAGDSNSVAMAPFTITNTSAIDYTFKISNSGWYFGGTAGTTVSSNITKIQVGLKLQYPSVASLYVKEHAAGKKVYLTYKGEAADPGSSTKTWGEMWNSGSSCSAGDDFFFRLNNGSILKGFGLLEQGFEAFNPTAASLSSEAPAAGQNVAY